MPGLDKNLLKNNIKEKVMFESKDGTKLVGLLETSSNKKDTCVILCHGVNSNKDEHGTFIRLSDSIRDNGMSVLRFDFRGHGESGGIDYEMTIEKEVEDVNAAVDFVKSYNYKKIILLGASFGGGVAAAFTSRNEDKVNKLILWYPLIEYNVFFDSNDFWRENKEKALKEGCVEIVSKRSGNRLKLGVEMFLEAEKINLLEELQKIKLPVLLVHGTNDIDVPYESSLKYSKCFENAKLKTIVDGTHVFKDSEYSLNQAIEATVEFVLK